MVARARERAPDTVASRFGLIARESSLLYRGASDRPRCRERSPRAWTLLTSNARTGRLGPESPFAPRRD